MKGQILRQEGQHPLGGHAVIAAAAHELKTPLTLIAYIAQMLADEELGLTQADRIMYVERLKLVSARTLRLVQHLTLSYRLEDAQQQTFSFALEPVNMREVCEAALHEMTPYAREYKQQLQLAANRTPMVVANREILYDIVVNLVDNAIRHNTPGTAVAVRPAARGEHVRLHVHDNGQGVSAASVARLRRTIGTAPQPIAGLGGSSGLGLYIVGQFAGAMGGSLGLGRAMQGTTFFVDLIRSRQLSLL
jgi:two-component system phosphate regulon sensor histidine kinase PhoR